MPLKQGKQSASALENEHFTVATAIHGADANGGVYRSADGTTWTSVATPTSLHAGGVKRIVLSNVGTSASILAFYETVATIATVGATNSKVGLKLYPGTGATWTDYTSKISLSSASTTTPKNIDTQGGYNMCITTKPDDGNVIYLGGVELFRFNRSTDAYEFIGGSQASANAINVHVDNHLLMFQSGSNVTMWAANDGGLRKTDVSGTIKTTAGADNGYDWTDRTSGYTTHQLL